MRMIKRITAFAFALALSLTLAACGGNAASSASSSAASASASASSSASAVQAGDLVGKPWITSVLIGNLPAEQPALKDDLYAHYDYEYLAAHQDAGASWMGEHAAEVPTALMKIIQDETAGGHDMEQLRLFYKQANDLEALKAAGIAELKPYLDRIDAVGSLEEMNALLTAGDFPFSPFIVAGLTINDSRTTNIVGIMPNLVLFDAMVDGGTYYQESDDPQTQAALDAAIKNAQGAPILDLVNIGAANIDSLEERRAMADQILKFEKAHGKFVESTTKNLKADYGFMAENARTSYFTLDELAAMMPNFPIKETLDKLGKGGSSTYVVTRAWAEAFNDQWTDANLDAIKLVAKAKLLAETRPYRDPSALNETRKAFGLPEEDTGMFAYKACANPDTFAQVMARAYADDVLGAGAKERLTKLSEDLVAEYKVLIDSTSWMGEESKARVTEKLDHMALNVLEPGGGYFDYSGLELVDAESGGTLFSNYLKLKQYRLDCESKLVGAPASQAVAWFTMNPLYSNAFYDATTNSINILPGFVTSQVYRDDMGDAELLACAGFTIAHEISHGFDYVGSQVDAYGQPNPVFADADVDAFVLKSSTLATYYKGIEIEPGLFVDGQNVASEATADLCGMQASLELAKKAEGFDYEKYFGSLSDMWAQTMSEESLQQRTLDVHPLNNLRINVNAQMFDAIYDVLGVAEGDGMYLAPTERIAIYGPKA